MTALLGIGDAARRLGLSVDTVRELERSGQLKAVRTAGGHRRFAPAVLDAWLARQSTPKSMRHHTPGGPRSARRAHFANLRDEPSDEVWDEPEATVRPQSAAPPFHERLLGELKAVTAERSERNRIVGLKSYGESLVPYGSTASARSAVIETLEAYVTARRFPPETDVWEARRAIEARVEAILEPYKEAADRRAAEKAEEEARRAAEEQDERRVQSLIEHGKSRAFFATTRWESEDREEARADVEHALEDEVESDWSEQDVEELVDDLLEEWEEEDA
jgi:excisionase family DNA binding protein